ncbi:hypothetical protein BDQ12DRAFT_688834, partial [Crucibulum laeve]
HYPTLPLTSPMGLCTQKFTCGSIMRSARMIWNASGSFKMVRNIYLSSEQWIQSQDGPFFLIGFDPCDPAISRHLLHS